MDGFVETLLTVALRDGEGVLDVKLRAVPIPRDAQEILTLPLDRLAIKHGPRHWLMDRIVVTDDKAVLVCRECQLRLEIPARATDLFALFNFWQQRYGLSGITLGFRLDQPTFLRAYVKRFPYSPART